jgi:pilus assembly protein FimV
MEFESDNIPPEETWAGPSTDAAPSGDEEVAYLPSDDVQSNGALQYNEADTKLDLARAYLDMGDKVGARSIIDEVMREGDPAQRDQAAELASQL